MTSKLIKVDRVRSADEAVEVEQLGADLIGVALSPDPRFDDDRTLTVEQAATVGQALRRAHLVVISEIADDPAQVLRTAEATGARLVQPALSRVPAPEVRVALRAAGIGIVCGGIEINHDDDPSWPFNHLTDAPDLEPTLVQADVLPEYEGSWAFLRDESPEYEDEFQIADLNELGRQHPLLAGLDFTPDNLTEILDALPSVRGILFTLADSARRGGVRFHPYAEVLRILSAR